MIHDPRLLQAVLDDPDDDAPRLAYATWCDAHADPDVRAQGDLIRSQIDLANTDPDAVRTGQAAGLQQHIDTLVERHGAAWRQPISGWVDAVHFVRGFAGWLECSAQAWLDHGAQIRALAPVQHLNLRGVRDVDERLADSPLLAGIRSLSMDGCGLHDIHVQLLAASKHVGELRWISMADNHLGLPASEALAASTSLGQLAFVELRSNPVDPVEELGYDGAIVVASTMPPEGQALEAKHGPQKWLHRDDPPGRFDR
ncbi:MAG: TIGR02996 domain-containing protein [Myxococcota bacterium]